MFTIEASLVGRPLRSARLVSDRAFWKEFPPERREFIASERSGARTGRDRAIETRFEEALDDVESSRLTG